MRGNVLDMAVGVVVGSAFTAIVTALVEDIMKLSRLDEGSEDLEQEDVDLYGLARKVLSDLRPIADQRGIALHIEGKGQKIHGVWRILHEMVYNLCENAIKYNKDQGSVTVKISGDEKQAVLSVQDTGMQNLQIVIREAGERGEELFVLEAAKYVRP